MDLFEDLVIAQKLSQESAQHIGRVYGFQWGIVTDREDPLGQGRVRAMVSNKGDKNLSDWLIRLEPSPLCSLPVPQVGDLVAICYESGDPHLGAYFGVAQNLTNPAADRESLKLTIGAMVLEVNGSGEVSLVAPSVVVNSPTVALQGASSVTINGSQVATVGAVDSAGHPLVSRGW